MMVGGESEYGVVVIIFPYQSLCELCLWTCMDLYQFEPSVENHDMRKMFFPVILLSLFRTNGAFICVFVEFIFGCTVQYL